MKRAQVLLQEKDGFTKVEAPCPYFGTCGGCSLQDLAYPDQLELKKQRLLRALGSLDPTMTLEMVGLEDPWRYRNKAELTFGESGGCLTLGYHAARSFWRIVDIEDCLLLPEPMSQLLRDARALAQQTTQAAYNPKTHQGFFRYLVIRASHATGKLLACLMTTQGPRRLIEEFADELMKRHSALVGFYWGINMKVADGLAVGLAGTLVCGFHDPWTSARDDRIACQDQGLGHFLREPVIRIGPCELGGAEDRHRIGDFG